MAGVHAALAYLTDHTADMALVDLQMPDIGDLDVLKGDDRKH